MSLSTAHWIAEQLIGPERAEDVQNTWSRSFLYGTTVGPFDGIGGAAMSTWTITVLSLTRHVEVYADKQLLGTLETRDLRDFLIEHFTIDGSPVHARDVNQVAR